MQDALEGACPLAVRRPSQWRELARNFTEEEKKYLTLYNDGMFGSETDLGTYGTLAMETPEQEPQSRGAELDWQRTAMRGRFCGGEAVQRAAGEENVSAEEAIRDLEKMHISYLNSTYDLQLLEQWKKETINGVSGFEAVGKRLGYRFVVENVEILSEKENRMWKMGEDSSGQMSLMRITLENHGFAGLTEEADCFLEIEEENKKPEKYRIHTDARAWHSGDTTILCRQIGRASCRERV